MLRAKIRAAVTTIALGMIVGSVLSLNTNSIALGEPLVPPAAGFPGLGAVEQLSPIIQQAAADPRGASSLLMTAANTFLNNANTPDGSREVADSVRQFLQSPSEGIITHTPTPGSGPDVIAHLPSGVDPRNAVGPLNNSLTDIDPLALPSAVSPQNSAMNPVPPNTDNSEANSMSLGASSLEKTGDDPANAAPLANGAVPDPLNPISSGDPIIQDFIYPSVGQNCLADGGNSIATALSVAGPASIPTPGPRAGQTAYVFTAVGTSGPAAEQKLPLNVTWVNLTTGRSGTTALIPRHDINPDGPTTLTAIVDTGSGSIMSTIFGQVTTQDKQCNFLPTIGSTVVP